MERPNLAAQALHLENVPEFAATGLEFVSRWGRDLEADQEEHMNTIDIQNQIEAGRKTIERSLDDAREGEMPEVPPAVIAAGVVAAVVAVGIIGWLVFRSGQRRPLIQRLQDVIPGSVRGLPTGLQSRIRRVK